ncbi:MAG: DNA polymerase Y family protein, partial [Proteobacteria bacterium]|nr:DNA polymerase Y family protein [Pseudomonadota bacterium]
MQWTALYLPRLPLESFLRASPTADPWAMAENRHVLDCNTAAFALGVRPRMARAAAAALAPGLRFCERDPQAERVALEGVAEWAGCYTPNVALAARAAGPAGLLLEVSGSLKLFGGLPALTAGLARGAAEMGFTASIASAPTAQGAWLLARAGASSPCQALADLPRRLQPLPVEVLDCDARTLATLESVGVRTLGEVLALPRAGLARRFGAALSDELDRALGTRPDPRTYFSPPETFYAGLELPAEVREAGALVFAARRLITQLGGFLAARDGGIQRFRIELFHKEARTDVDIGLVRPGRDTGHFALLAREKLSALALREPVRRIALAADEVLAVAHETLDLLDDALKRPGDWHGLVERLRARLGNHAVSGVATCAEHRPEAAWRVAEPGARSPA